MSEKIYVYVVTNPENGWDCVRGVYSSKELALKSLLPEDASEEDIENFSEHDSNCVIHKITFDD
jgi:hypothetical protein